MIIKRLTAQNYRTLENVDIEFKGFYTAISGRNNAGKSNIIRAILGILGQRMRFRLLGSSILGVDAFDWNEDVTSWKKGSKEDLTVSLYLEIDKELDSSIYRFLTDLIFKEAENINIQAKEILRIEFSKTHKNETRFSVFLGDNEVRENFQKQEVLKRLRGTQCLTFHNSTKNESFSPFGDSIDRVTNFIRPKDLDVINKKREDLAKSVQKSLKGHQEELTSLLGNLEEKYEVSLSTQGLNFERETIDTSLKEKGVDVSLNDWGSGTKNRTLIFLNILNAKRAQSSGDESDRITPIVIIEEPECFLHPQAQAEFGRILQNIATELQIQVIVTTHSPYLLSFKEPSANILIGRNTKPKCKDPSSYITEIDTDTDSWCKPFAVALGINQSDFGPMKDVIFSENSKVLLVEGVIDKDYMHYLQEHIHGENSLRRDIEIFAYDGADNLKNNILLNLIKSKFDRVVATVDFDRFESVEKSMTAIGFQVNVDLFPIGKKEEGKQSIEGLIPTSVCSTVYGKESEIVRRATMSTGKTQKSAKSELKRKLLDDFKRLPISKETHGDFYQLTKKINKAFK